MYISRIHTKMSHYNCYFLCVFAYNSGGNILEQIASDESADDVSLVRRFLSACKNRTVKQESINVEVAVKG